ncbi:MAG: GGDEF domain-containing protein [Rubrivivax sp.]|nr:GGDEF domain-containing protein [Rubrivivax sp.]
MLHPPALPLSGHRAPEGPPLEGSRSSPAGIEPGQAEFLAVIERHLSQCRRYGQPLAVLSIGIEGVGTLDGRPVDGMESAVSHELWNRLRARTRAKDSVVRLAGLEYGVLLPGCRPKDAPGTRQRLALTLGGVYALGSDPVITRVSIGLASLCADIDNAAGLWAAALEARADGRPPAAPTAPAANLRR